MALAQEPRLKKATRKSYKAHDYYTYTYTHPPPPPSLLLYTHLKLLLMVIKRRINQAEDRLLAARSCRSPVSATWTRPPEFSSAFLGPLATASSIWSFTFSASAWASELAAVAEASVVAAAAVVLSASSAMMFLPNY